MSKSKFAGVVFAGFMLSAGVVNAQSVFPSSSNEASPTGLTQHAEGSGAYVIGAMQPVFPSAAIEHGPAREVTVTVRSAGERPTMATSRSAFPTSAREHGPSL
jgi:hypothetical protein